MERPLLAVILGTFTLRLATGLTGAMLVYYYAVFPEYGGEPVTAFEVGRPGRAVLRLRARPVAAVRRPVGPDRPPPGHAHRTGVRRRSPSSSPRSPSSLPVIGVTRLLEGASTAASVPSILGFIAFATAADELLRGKAVARFEAATLAGLMAGFVARRRPVRGAGADRVHRQRARLPAVVRDLQVRRAAARGAGAGRPRARPRGGPAPLPGGSSRAATSGCSRRPGSPSTRRSACSRARRCSSSSGSRTRSSRTRR